VAVAVLLNRLCSLGKAELMSFSGKPWDARRAEIPLEIFIPLGMIGAEERRCYFWLAKHGLTNSGCVVDAGSFVGASTVCFAAGAAAGGHVLSGVPTVHAYDFFEARDAYVAKWIRENFGAIEDGASYLDIFHEQMEGYTDITEAHPGDFAQQRWTGDPIGILFIDVAKKPHLNAHLVGEFFPSLIPGQSFVIHQDYYHCWHPYIHYSMEYFGDAFEIVDELVLNQSRVWRLVKPLPAEKIARLRDGALGKDERMALLDRVVAQASAQCRPMMEVVRLWQRCLDEDYDAAKLDFAELDGKYGYRSRHEIWAKQAIEVNRYCEKMDDERLARDFMEKVRAARAERRARKQGIPLP
jgi:hypothetical protein